MLSNANAGSVLVRDGLRLFPLIKNSKNYSLVRGNNQHPIFEYPQTIKNNRKEGKISWTERYNGPYPNLTALSFFVHVILTRQCESQISELCHFFKGSVSYFCGAILSCLLCTRYDRVFSAFTFRPICIRSTNNKSPNVLLEEIGFSSVN